MPKVTMVGAGSAVFARQVMTDILAVDGLDRGVFALVDIDPDRLDLARRIAERLVEISGKAWAVEASTDRMEVLRAPTTWSTPSRSPACGTCGTTSTSR